MRRYSFQTQRQNSGVAKFSFRTLIKIIIYHNSKIYEVWQKKWNDGVDLSFCRIYEKSFAEPNVRTFRPIL